ncbi:MAG: hypothetical protein WC872_03245 [Candidatus Absconditabacterales bacterium]
MVKIADDFIGGSQEIGPFKDTNVDEEIQEGLEDIADTSNKKFNYQRKEKEALIETMEI